ncbi:MULTISPECIES: hypothetical protein [Bacillales]|jgi:hypothetical protein|uniref:HARE-HTH domain-containing protein n=1 Tax=Brevibacillus aydinogluensis TaxID=927786 RepID=A0AA48M8M6_9BACL|nr:MULTISPECIES: hypothetical protein [Bacillales]REK64601.1 MAG: hypothetical protein DF221_07885 [Brevibacillus sp.]MBR8659356.1 hypothetical protein [Brevibacillus sp. NL20B1]MDT3414483.1 hypothetical protein [Brevibacillus aydinogluensis]NNV02509.1 hypothetical protein [Brevibacillus sp. MCWH]UFJ60064.1 hypothetical protein IRT44_12160 [Anoxybacillus sediminis]
MSAAFHERKALQMTLQSLLELRVSLRREYVDRDKELGSEIKQVLHRIRELDEQYGLPAETQEQEEDLASWQAMPREVLDKHVGRPRKAYQHHDYPGIAKDIEAILEEAAGPLTLAELYDKLQQKKGVEWPSPYIIVQKALKHTDRVRVSKEGRKLLFSLQ